MFSTENILNMLQSGQDADAIAAQFASALNQALAQQKAQGQYAEKIEFMEGIIDDLFDFIEEFYPDMDVTEARNEIDAEEIVKGLDDAYREVVRLKQMLQVRKAAANKIQPTAVPVHTGDAITDFLKRNGL